MKYIRTRNFIVELETWMEIGNDTLFIGGARHKIVKQADTIEELYDGYVIESKNNPAIWFEITCDEFSRQKPSFNYWIIYAYIKTDKGLIYVAKMKGILPSGEIDWELL